jgi:rubrerythrin
MILIMKNFNTLSEREILALAISLEEEDERVYADFAEGLKQDFPASASVFDAMRGDESGHRRRLIELYRQKFGEHIPLIRRQDVKGFVPRKPVWLVRPLGLDTVRRQASAIEVETRRFYERAAMRTQDASVRQLLDDLAQEERTHEDRAQELTEEKLRQRLRKMKTRRVGDFLSCRSYNRVLLDSWMARYRRWLPCSRLLLQLETPGMRFLSDWPRRSVQELAWVSPRRCLTTAASQGGATLGSVDWSAAP